MVSRDVKDFATAAFFVVLGLIVAVSVTFGIRSATNITTPITVYTPKPGVSCALATTTDGVALACWKD